MPIPEGRRRVAHAHPEPRVAAAAAPAQKRLLCACSSVFAHKVVEQVCTERSLSCSLYFSREGWVPNVNEGSFGSHGITCFSVPLKFSNANICFIIQSKLIELSF